MFWYYRKSAMFNMIWIQLVDVKKKALWSLLLENIFLWYQFTSSVIIHINWSNLYPVVQREAAWDGQLFMKKGNKEQTENLKQNKQANGILHRSLKKSKSNKGDPKTKILWHAFTYYTLEELVTTSRYHDLITIALQRNKCKGIHRWH